MLYSRRFVRGWCAVAVLLLTSCVDEGPLDPSQNGDLTGLAPSAAVVQGDPDGTGDFYFLPPLVKNPSIAGTFNPNLLPTMRVCVLSGEGGLDDICDPAYPPTVSFAEGSITVADEQYQLNWDTDGPETGPDAFDWGKFYRLEILVAASVVGSLDLDPQDPEGPGQSEGDYYAFRVGETIPVKFWLSSNMLCDPSSFVEECVAGAFMDTDGGKLAIDAVGERLSVQLFELPGGDPITVVIERLNPGDLPDDVECIGSFDAPQFGPCFRITTYPELTATLDTEALVSICMDVDPLTLGVPEGQEDLLQIVRFGGEDINGDPVLQALPNEIGDCSGTGLETASLLGVPERGLFRYAALGLNALARLVGPQPLAAHGAIRLGGLTSSFSRFRFALPGQMTVTGGDGTILHVDGPNAVPTEITVIDSAGTPVKNAIVHFSTDDGTISDETATTGTATTDNTGAASITWYVNNGTAGTKTLTAWARGLLDHQVPSHRAGYFFDIDAVEVNVIVCQEGDGYGTATFGTPFTFNEAEWACADSAHFTANISGGDTPAEVLWMNDGTNLYMAVRVFQSSLAKANSLLIDFDNDGDGAIALNHDAIGYDADRGSFFDRHVTKKCLNSSQSGCGADDEHPDGAGAIANDGQWTTYVLSHPLDNSDPQDIEDISVETDGLPGFFLTLRVGKGAQGNTQWPGFRVFQSMAAGGSQ